MHLFTFSFYFTLFLSTICLHLACTGFLDLPAPQVRSRHTRRDEERERVTRESFKHLRARAVVQDALSRVVKAQIYDDDDDNDNNECSIDRSRRQRIED